MTTATIILRPGRERPVMQRHPWIFSGAVARVEGQPAAGDAVEVRSAQGHWLARGTWSSSSQIRVRLFSWDEHEALDTALLQRRLEQALAARGVSGPLAPDTLVAQRLVYAEADGLPGLIVDQYGAYLVLQLLTQGMACRLDTLLELLRTLLAPLAIYERSDVDVRHKEGLPLETGLRWGSEPPATLPVQHRARTAVAQPPVHMQADVRAGQKTGLYLDQAENRARVAAYCKDAAVLDCFCYNGGFALYAAQAGAAQITVLDSSAAALEQTAAHMRLNNLATPLETDEGDAFTLLRAYRAAGRQFDVVVLDPPRFAQSQGHVERATRGYKDINMGALHLLRPGGVLATFSCSGLVSSDLFQKVVFGAALDAGRTVQILERATQAPDHPVLLSFPESAYLKGLICQVW